MVIGDPDSVGHVESTRGDGMSPEERATQVVVLVDEDQPYAFNRIKTLCRDEEGSLAYGATMERMRGLISEAIRAAVLEEREACAQVVESRYRFDENGVTLRGAINPELVNAAAAIRARV